MTVELTSSIVKEYGLEAGADIVGIAQIDDFIKAPKGFNPTDALPDCHSVIVLGGTFSPEDYKSVDKYSATRNAMLSKMTEIAKRLAKRLKKEGYNTKAISAAGGKWVQGEGRKELLGYISLKHAAEIAGLGVIGKNYLLTNPKYGNLLWLSAVLTDAVLEPDERITQEICTSCMKCVNGCPIGALDDQSKFKRKECSSFYMIEDKKFKLKCYKCRTVCPNCNGMQTE